MLAKQGCKVTQATLSRDLKMMKAVRTPTPTGGYRYVLPEGNLEDYGLSGWSSTGNDSLSIEVTGNLAVIRTIPGHSIGIGIGIAKHLDSVQLPEVLTSIVCPASVIAVLRENVSKQHAIDVLKKALMNT
ncbi:MAG: hypothetical protein KBT10_01805 [Bacteroidales bacterium]|nr:hypothetical protein [Candidatus Sodaliphilus aphodohippi]